MDVVQLVALLPITAAVFIAPTTTANIQGVCRPTLLSKLSASKKVLNLFFYKYGGNRHYLVKDIRSYAAPSGTDSQAPLVNVPMLCRVIQSARLY